MAQADSRTMTRSGGPKKGAMTKSQRYVPAIILLVLTIVLVTEASAAPIPAVSFTGSTSTTAVNSCCPQSLGWEFTVSAPIQVTHLGVYDDDLDGLLFAHDVAIWSTAGSAALGSALGTATVPSGTTAPLTAQFRYVALVTPFVLAPGSYIIGATWNGGSPDDYIAGGALSAFTTAAGITFFEPRHSGGFSPFTRPVGPSFSGINPGVFGPNFQFTAVPEPGTLTLTALGVAGLAARFRRRRS
jgi:hypothetical protein